MTAIKWLTQWSGIVVALAAFCGVVWCASRAERRGALTSPLSCHGLSSRMVSG
jgi:cytosine/uracil/thiamine/allantoin permease